MSTQRETKIRVYYHDTDAQGVVYHSKYLDFAERGRSEFLRDQDDAFNRLFLDQGYTFDARHAEIEYLYPARYDDELRLVTYSSDLGNTSFTVHTDAYIGDRLINRVKVKGVLLNKDWKPVEVPEEIRAVLI